MNGQTPGTPLLAPKKLSIPRLRRLLLVVLTLSTIAFTTGVFVLVQRIFQNFGPGVEQDLIWKAVRGAEELAHAADLGLAVKDAKIVGASFGEYRRSDDVLGIAAIAADGALVASAGQLPEPLENLFSGPAGTVRRTPGYVVAWAPALIEGSPVGKVAMIVKTRRLVQAQALLRRMSLGTGAAGIIVWLLGVLFVNFFTRSIVERDNQLAEYASGLEEKVALRTAELDRANEEMRLVLDNVQQGFITVSLEGVMAEERSTIVDRWFGPQPADRKFSTLIRPFDSGAADWFDVGCDGLRDGFMPAAVVLEQFPKRLMVGGHTLRLSYIGIGEGESPRRLLIVLSDVTDELARERVERDAREMTRAFQQITAERVGFEQFFAEANAIVKQILAGSVDRNGEKRLIHTLKGNCSIFGIDSVAESCHQLETKLQDEGRRATELERARLAADWDRTAGVIAGLLGDRPSVIELDEGEYQGLLGALRGGKAGPELVRLVESWRLEPVSFRLARLAAKARYVVKRQNDRDLTVHVDGAGLRLDGAVWSPFWTALVHAVTNALDHGIESAAERQAQGKPPGANLWLTAEACGEGVIISVRDDGRGIDWARVKDKAAAAGVPHGSRADLAAALFADGVSTTGTASVSSGRGVGMGAMREAIAALDGEIDVVSERHQGTTLKFRFPRRR
ncbi:MAG TPA: ATP-binding protein [Polyangia bacterium]|nr:ATP-binding protein [Polyangia bacterium]